MKEFLKSLSSYSLAVSLFPIEMARSVLSYGDREHHRVSAVEALDSITGATVRQFGGAMIATFSALDHAQRGLIAVAFNTLLPSGSNSAPGASGRR
jgi:hypothetical protein